MLRSITAVIPVYNRVKYLHAALQSVFDQSCPPDEVIVVDDCSTKSIHHHLVAFPPPGPVKVLRTDRNRRVAGARNWGWRNARTEWIAFLDSDDLWEPFKLQAQLDFLERNPSLDGVYGAMRVFWPDGKTEIWGDNRPPLVDAKFALIDCNINVQTLLIRRAALERLGGFDERFGILDDRAIAIRIGELGLNIGFFADPPVALHRRHGRNYSSHSWRFFMEQCRLVWDNRSRSNTSYGPGSSRVHLGRALDALACASPLARIPAWIVSRILFVTAPSSTMPRKQLWQLRDLDFGSPLPPIPREPDRGDLLARQERGATAAWD